MHFNASRSLTQPLLDCILYLTQYFYDPGILPNSANLVYPWESVSEIQSIKESLRRLVIYYRGFEAAKLVQIIDALLAQPRSAAGPSKDPPPDVGVKLLSSTALLSLWLVCLIKAAPLSTTTQTSAGLCGRSQRTFTQTLLLILL